MVYELRIYDTAPGKLPLVLKRFETLTLRMWEKHGIQQAGFWTVQIGASNLKLYYMLRWDSLAEREQKWASFVKDPEWIRERNETEKEGPLVTSVSNEILVPTAFSAVK
jgi:hypothetical protein